MTRRGAAAVGGAAAILLSLVFTTGVLVAQPGPMQPGAGGTITHDQLHEMMDAMHGEGFSERMHQAMPGAEEMMEQCVGMLTTMRQLPGMMGGREMPGMMNGMRGHSPRTSTKE